MRQPIIIGAAIAFGFLFGCDSSGSKSAADAPRNTNQGQMSVAPHTVEPSAANFSSAKTVFEKKLACAEEGRKYFARKRLQLGPVLPANYFDVAEPIFAYNKTFDTCLCLYQIQEIDPAANRTRNAGWLDDVFTNLPIAQFTELKHSDGSVENEGMMSREEFWQKSNQLLDVK